MLATDNKLLISKIEEPGIFVSPIPIFKESEIFPAVLVISKITSSIFDDIAIYILSNLAVPNTCLVAIPVDSM